jgi:hypothetical protein
MLDNNYQISRYYFTRIMKRNINSDTMNWNSIIKKEVRGINDAYLGIVQGISEPFIITKKGTVIKEKFFIPKNLLEGYDDIIVYCKIAEKDARNNFMRNLQPLHDDYYSNYTITDINEEGKLQNNINKKIQEIILLYMTKQNLSKIKGTSNKITEIIQSVVRTTEQKIKEAPIVIKKLEEVNLESIAKETSNTIKRLAYTGFKVAAANLSTMSQFAIQFSNSFEYILSNIRRRTYSQRERIQHFSKQSTN